MEDNLKTNFKKVMDFNRAFDMVLQEPNDYSCYEEDCNGNIKCNPFKNIRKDIFTSSPFIIKLRLDLIKEELNELNVAIIETDIIEQRDACADILYVVYGMADVLGIEIDDYFNIKLNQNLEHYISNININNTITTTNIQKISNFNKIKDITNEILGINIYSKTAVELIQIIKDNLYKSYLELETNCYNNDTNDDATKFELVADNIYDLLRWTYIMTIIIGTDADSDFAIVHESNMSKLCSTEEDAIKTVEDYQLKYVAGVSPYDSPYFYYLPNLNKWIVKNLSTGKALKNIKYKKVSFVNPRFVF